MLAFCTAIFLPPVHALDPNNPETWQTYCLDYDQDSYGGATLTFPFNSDTPPSSLWVLNCEDPDDYNPFAFPTVTAKGNRIIGVDFADPAADGQWRPDLARELGAEVAPLRVAWSQIETAPGRFDGSQVDGLDRAMAYAAQGFKVSLTLTLADGASLSAPPDLQTGLRSGTLKLSDPAVVTRYKALLRFLHQRLQGVALVSLQLGDNVDQLAGKTAVLSDYLALFQQAAPFARSLWGPDLKVATTIDFKNLQLLPTNAQLYALVAAGDFLSLNYFGFGDVLPLGQPPQVESVVAVAVAAAGSKPIAFQQILFPSSDVFTSSQTKQSQFIRAFFFAWDTRAEQIFYACFARLFDLPSSSLTGLSEPFASYLGSIGLRENNGSAKAAYHTLRNQAFERGWWRVDAPPTRPFYMGFTQLMYDVPTDPYQTEWTKAWTDFNLWKEGDITAIHMDGGVPWTEALNDDLSSFEPPYAQSLRGSWRLASGRLIPGRKLLVSINPLGIPRRVIAPYWGYGQGFTYATDFTRVGDGQFSDNEARMPPAPFDAYPLNHPDVKRAYLNYARRVLSYFHPDYLCIGIEVSAAQIADPTVFRQYLELHKYVYQALKADPKSAHTKILVSISATSFMTDEYGPLLVDKLGENGIAYKYDEMGAGVRQGVIQALHDILPYTDIVGLSLYLHYGKYNAYALPASVYDSLFSTLKEAGLGNKPIAVTESGYAGDAYTLFERSLFAASEEKQERHIKLMFYELTKQPNPVEFIINYEIRDTDYAWQRLAVGAPDPRFVEFYKYFRDMGLYDGDGNERSSLQKWRGEFARPLVPRP